MRQTWATNFMRVPGASLLELKRQGGWQRREQVERYSHAVPHHDRRTLPNPLGVRKTAFGQLLSTRVSRAFQSSAKNTTTSLSARRHSRKSVGREGIEPPQPKAADLQSAELTTLLNLPAIGALHPILRAWRR
jgi:hypothetical protein